MAALEAAHQARFATDPAIRRAMATIAQDETRHGQLSLDLQRWLLARLAPPARRRTELVHRRTIHSLRQHLGRTRPAALHTELGLPDIPRAHALLDDLERRVVMAGMYADDSGSVEELEPILTTL